MTDIDQRLHEAYDSVRLPDDVRARTLAAIEAARRGTPAVSDTSDSATSQGGAPLASKASLAFDAAEGNSASATAVAPTVAVVASRRRPRRLVALAACLLLVLAGIGGIGAFRAYATPAAYVDISVNPAIQLTVNASGTVISAEGLNKDGKEVLATVNLAHCSYQEAMDSLIASAAFLSYLSEDSLIDVSIASDDAQLGAALAEQTDATLAGAPCQHQCHRADGTTCGGGQGHGHGNGAGMGNGHGFGHRGVRQNNHST